MAEKDKAPAKAEALAPEDLDAISGGRITRDAKGFTAPGDVAGFTAPGDVAGMKVKELSDGDLDKVSGGFKVEIEGVKGDNHLIGDDIGQPPRDGQSFDEADTIFGKGKPKG